MRLLLFTIMHRMKWASGNAATQVQVVETSASSEATQGQVVLPRRGAGSATKVRQDVDFCRAFLWVQKTPRARNLERKPWAARFNTLASCRWRFTHDKRGTRVAGGTSLPSCWKRNAVPRSIKQGELESLPSLQRAYGSRAAVTPPDGYGIPAP